MHKPPFDQYYRYDEMTQLLRDFTQAFPLLAVSATSISRADVDQIQTALRCHR